MRHSSYPAFLALALAVAGCGGEALNQASGRGGD